MIERAAPAIIVTVDRQPNQADQPIGHAAL